MKRGRWIAAAALLLVVGTVTAAFATGLQRNPSLVRSVLIGRPAPPLSGRTLAGTFFRAGSVHGKVLLVTVWASWCPSCQSEQGLLDAVQRQLGPRGLQVVGIDMTDSASTARAFLTRTGGELYPNIFDPDATLAIDWGTFGVPESYLVDRAGIVRAKMTGTVTTAWIDQQVLPLLGSG